MIVEDQLLPSLFIDVWEEISKLNTPPSYYAGVHLIKEKMDNIDKTELSHQLS